MGNGVRQCAQCGWTCYGSRSEMKKHRRAVHPKRPPEARPRPPLPVNFDAPSSAELAAYPELAVAEFEENKYEVLLDVLAHIHDDLCAIRAHLGIARPECEPPDPPLDGGA